MSTTPTPTPTLTANPAAPTATATTAATTGTIATSDRADTGGTAGPAGVGSEAERRRLALPEIGLVLALSSGLSWASVVVGLTVRDPHVAQWAEAIWTLPWTLVSSAFVSPSSMPDVVRALVEANPIALTLDATRSLTIGEGGALSPAVASIAWLAGLLAVLAPLASRTAVSTGPDRTSRAGRSAVSTAGVADGSLPLRGESLDAQRHTGRSAGRSACVAGRDCTTGRDVRAGRRA